MALPGVPPSSERAFAAHAGLEVPGKNGIPTGVDLKSAGSPKKSQRFGLEAGGLTGSEPVPQTSVPRSIGPQGWGLDIVNIEVICHPSSICANDFLPGKRYVIASVNRWRISKSLLAYSAPVLYEFT